MTVFESTPSFKHAFGLNASMLSQLDVISCEMTPYAQRLAEAMKLARLTGTDAQGRLAEAVGITRQAVSMALSGSTKAFSAEKSARAARFLKVDHFWLATGEGEPRPPGLSEEARDFAVQFDKLSESERRRWKYLLLASRDGVPSEVVEQKMPITKQRKREEKA